MPHCHVTLLATGSGVRLWLVCVSDVSWMLDMYDRISVSDIIVFDINVSCSSQRKMHVWIDQLTLMKL